MANKTSKVTAVIAAQVTGAADVATLAKTLAQIPDETDAVIAAKVTGDEAVAGLAADLAAMPTSTRTEVAAGVTGEQQVAGLAADLDALPASVRTKVTAQVRGDQLVDELRRDVAALDESKDVRIRAQVRGDQQVDELRRDMAALDESKQVDVRAQVRGDGQVDELRRDMQALDESKNVDVRAQVRGDGQVDELRRDMQALDETKTVDVKAQVRGEEQVEKLDRHLEQIPARQSVDINAQVHGDQKVQKFGDEMGHVRDRTSEAHGEVAGLGSEVTGTLGGQFSDGTGYVADFAEQFRNLKIAARESGGGMKAAAAGLAGIGATLAGGFLLDSIISSFQEAAAQAQAFKDAASSGLPELTEQYYEYGDAVDDATKRATIFALSQNAVFVQLVQSGADWVTTMDAFYKGDVKSWGSVMDQVAKNSGNLSFEQRNATNAALGAGGALVAQTGNAKAAGDQINAYAEAQGLAREETDKATDSVDSSVDSLGVLGTAGDTVDTVADALAQMAADAAQAAEDAAQLAVDTDGVSTALDGVSDAAASSQRSLQFLGAEIDKLAGRNRTGEEAAADLASSVLGLGDALKEGAKGGDVSKKALAEWDVAALNSTKSGQAIYTSVNQVRTAYDESVTSAYEAAAATGDLDKAQEDARKSADAARKSFIKQATAQGLTTKQAEKLADKVGILAGKKIPDKSFDLLAKDKKAQQAIKDLEAKKLADKVQKINGDKSPAERTIALLKNAKIADKIQEIRGKDTDARSKIKALVALGIPPKEAKIIAEAKNTAEAQREIEKVAKTYQAYIDVSVLGLDAVKAALKAVQGIVNNITGKDKGAPPPPPPSGLTTSSTGAGLRGTAPPTAAAAPTSTTHRVLRTSTGAGVVVNNVTVNGALDPVGTAKTVRDLINGNQRRTGPANLTIPRTPV